MPVVPCTNTPPVFGIVQFDPPTFVALYPEFTGLPNGQMQKAFGMATLMLNNTCGSRVQDANQREILLDLLTAHFLFLNNGTNDGAGAVVPPPGIVGRISSATEGSVSVASEFDVNPTVGNAFLSQTKYGTEFLGLTINYRTLVYLPAPDSCGFGGPFGPGGSFDGGGSCGC
jgi:hypothetical protein